MPERLGELLRSGLDVKLHLLQHYAELARLLAREILDEEVVGLCGARYSRDKPLEGRYRRWGSNPGSIRIGSERVPIEVPRVREVEADRERSLESYQQMKQPLEMDQRLEEAILLGLSQRDYGRVASAFLDGFGLSQSSVSRAFQERSRRALEAFEQRSLAEEDFVALWIDGKHLAGVQLVICLGLTIDGRKLPLGFVETTTENTGAIKGLLQDLIGRGLDFGEGLLCVIDGSKGLYKAVREVFGTCAEVQRCQWHKRENVVSYLPRQDQASYRRKLQRAYQKVDYGEAKAALMEIHAELEQVNRSAARSLLEGLEETLTLHRLGLFEQLGKSLKTTNCIWTRNASERTSTASSRSTSVV
ncbi:transposase [Rhodocaloribacter litoris]|uniref:IS256 family transposase n=1 Tax=Rhodocaloribacter litoris TaxID=2558931 RepID=UPI0014243DBB|nr:transposase [Rhodocaloribacter litoris]QXD16667.1 transposase [Rhodocaloribacter litoris]